MHRVLHTLYNSKHVYVSALIRFAVSTSKYTKKKVAHMLCEYSLFISSQRESTNHTTVVIFFLFSTKKKFYFVSFENKQQQETEFHLAFVHVLYSNPGTSRLFTFCTI